MERTHSLTASTDGDLLPPCSYSNNFISFSDSYYFIPTNSPTPISLHLCHLLLSPSCTMLLRTNPYIFPCQVLVVLSIPQEASNLEAARLPQKFFAAPCVLYERSYTACEISSKHQLREPVLCVCCRVRTQRASKKPESYCPSPFRSCTVQRSFTWFLQNCLS